MLHRSCSHLPGSKYLMEWHSQTINQPRRVSEQSTFVNCQQRAYLSQSATMIHSSLLRWQQWCHYSFTRHVSEQIGFIKTDSPAEAARSPHADAYQCIGGFLLMLSFYYSAVNPQVSCHPWSPLQIHRSLVCSSNYFYLSTSNEIRSKYIDGGSLRWCFSEELSNTERCDAASVWHKDLHCTSLSVTLTFLTIIIAAKAHIDGVIK